MVTDSLITILAQSNKIRPSINILLFFYFIIIHFGMFIWLVSGIFSIAKKKLSFKKDFVKLFFSIIGALGVLPIIWEFLTRFNDSAGAREAGLGLLFSNLPAFIITGVFYEMDQSGLSIYLIIFYPLFGFIGGWGISQFLEWVVSMLRTE